MKSLDYAARFRTPRMDTTRAYPHIGAESFLNLIQHYGSASQALRASSSEIAQLAHNGKKAAAHWHDTHKAQAATEAALLWEQHADCRLLLLCDDDYPMMLTEGLTAPPFCLCVAMWLCCTNLR